MQSKTYNMKSVGLRISLYIKEIKQDNKFE